MKRKHIITLVTCIILAIAGICYSCSYVGSKTKAPVITTLSELPEGGETETSSTVFKESSKESENSKEASKGSIQSSSSTGEVESPLETIQSNSDSALEDKKDIYVHLCGAVTNPKVYQVKDGTRLVDLILLAGGLTDTAAGDYINQAVQVKDGQRIYIPTKEEIENLDAPAFITGGSGDATGQADTIENKLININEADAALLMTLPGIGQAKADSILEYRRTKGTFETKEELMNVPGIKEGMYSKISSYIIVE